MYSQLWNKVAGQLIKCSWVMSQDMAAKKNAMVNKVIKEFEMCVCVGGGGVREGRRER